MIETNPCDWLATLSDNKLSANNLGSGLVENDCVHCLYEPISPLPRNLHSGTIKLLKNYPFSKQNTIILIVLTLSPIFLFARTPDSIIFTSQKTKRNREILEEKWNVLQERNFFLNSGWKIKNSQKKEEEKLEGLCQLSRLIKGSVF